MKFLLYLFFILFVTTNNLLAQEKGILHVVEENSIRQMLDHRKALNFQKERKLQVWSVQLYLSRDKYSATQKVTEIKKITQDITTKVDWFYEAPYYRIYAGGFYTKLEAATLLQQLIGQFPDAIVFKNTEAKPTDM